MHIATSLRLGMKNLPLVSAALLSAQLLATPALAGGFDLVIKNGRVMDPETGFDAVANVGINNGYITEITTNDIDGTRAIDAKGHVVAPGFLDYHAHAQSEFGHKLYVRDGVTTPLDLEVGAFPVQEFYEFWEGKSFVNYGTNVAHVGARVAVLHEGKPNGRILYSTALGAAVEDGAQFKTKTYDPLDEAAIVDAIEAELKQGGIGIAYPIGYYTVVGSPEINAVTALAGKYGVPITTHVRSLPSAASSWPSPSAPPSVCWCLVPCPASCWP